MDGREYEPTYDGAVIAIRIYYRQNRAVPMADLIFAYGGMETIEWTNVEQRNEYMKGINGYTFIFDERSSRRFEDFLRKKS